MRYYLFNKLDKGVFDNKLNFSKYLSINEIDPRNCTNSSNDGYSYGPNTCFQI